MSMGKINSVHYYISNHALAFLVNYLVMMNKKETVALFNLVFYYRKDYLKPTLLLMRL